MDSKFSLVVTASFLKHFPPDLLLLHVRVLDVLEGHKGLLDGLGRGPLEHVVRASSLVIGAWKEKVWIRRLLKDTKLLLFIDPP